MFADCKVTQALSVLTIESRVKIMKRIEELVLPVVLLLTGLILIGGDRAGVLSLDRIQNLWPMAFILVGLTDFLTAKDEKENPGGERRRV